LALALVAIEAPQATQAHASQRTEAQRIVALAKSHIGARFRIGTTGMRYFDCSGLVYRVYAQAGLLNRIGGNRKRAAGYYAWFHKRGLASRNNPQVGDLIVWTKHGRIHHIGMYIGRGLALSALTTGVKIHHIGTISVKFLTFLHVRLQR
jgi:cell wall-associated NlpC family hydrolase